MEIIVYRPGADTVEEGFTVEQLPELLRDESLVIWIDMEKPEAEDDKVFLDVFHFHPLNIEDARQDRHHPKVEEFPNYLFFIVHGVRTNTTPERFNTVELDGFLGRNYVVTYHHEPFTSIDIVKQRVRTTPTACQRGSSFLLHLIIDKIVDDYLPVLDDFDERISNLEDSIFRLRQPNNQILEEIQNMKRSVLRLRRISSKQLDILYRMSHGEFALISGAILPFYRDIYDHLVRVSDLAESYRDLLEGSFNAYVSVVSNRMNEIMKVLTIFSAIMLPLSVIAGVYGMNFEHMPELRTRNGYFVVLAFMAVVAIGMLAIFWWRGWLSSGSKRQKS